MRMWSCPLIMISDDGSVRFCGRHSVETDVALQYFEGFRPRAGDETAVAALVESGTSDMQAA